MIVLTREEAHRLREALNGYIHNEMNCAANLQLDPTFLALSEKLEKIFVEESPLNFWLGLSPHKENLAIHIGTLVVDLLNREADGTIRIQKHSGGHPQNRNVISFRFSCGDHHAQVDIDPEKRPDLIDSPRRKAQHTSEDLTNLIHKQRDKTRGRGEFEEANGGRKKYQEQSPQPFDNYVDHGVQE